MSRSFAVKNEISATVALGFSIFLAGCGGREEASPRPQELASANTNREPSATELQLKAQLANFTNQLSNLERGQEERIQRLLTRIEDLDRKNVEQAVAVATSNASRDALNKAYDEKTQALQKQVGDLQAKVALFESGRILPEIVLAPDDSPTTRELDQKIRVVQRNNELAAEAADAKAKEQPRMALGANGFQFSSADTNFTVSIKGLVQLDSRSFLDDNPLSKGNDTFLLRRARPILQGTVFRDFEFQFVPDFGGNSVQIFDANLNYRLRPELQLRAGKFKGPVGLENLQSDAMLPFNERSVVSVFVPSRNVGIQLWGEFGGGALSYAVGVFNVAGDARNPNTSDFGDEKEFAGRLFSQPFKGTGISALEGFGFGLGASYSQISSNAAGLPSTTGGTLPGYFTTGQQQFFAYNPLLGPVVGEGAQWRASPQAYYYWGSVGLLGEFIVSHQSLLNATTLREDEFAHKAWQLSAQWVLTGEAASYNGIVPRRPFDPRVGGWGAWQLVARLSEFELDKNTFPAFANPRLSANELTSWSVGINWWLNRNVRFLASFTRTSFEGGGAAFSALDPLTQSPPATVTFQDESVFQTRLQLSF